MKICLKKNTYISFMCTLKNMNIIYKILSIFNHLFKSNYKLKIVKPRATV